MCERGRCDDCRSHSSLVSQWVFSVCISAVQPAQPPGGVGEPDSIFPAKREAPRRVKLSFVSLPQTGPRLSLLLLAVMAAQ